MVKRMQIVTDTLKAYSFGEETAKATPLGRSVHDLVEILKNDGFPYVRDVKIYVSGGAVMVDVSHLLVVVKVDITKAKTAEQKHELFAEAAKEMKE